MQQCQKYVCVNYKSCDAHSRPETSISLQSSIHHHPIHPTSSLLLNAIVQPVHSLLSYLSYLLFVCCLFIWSCDVDVDINTRFSHMLLFLQPPSPPSPLPSLPFYSLPSIWITCESACHLFESSVSLLQVLILHLLSLFGHVMWLMLISTQGFPTCSSSFNHHHPLSSLPFLLFHSPPYMWNACESSHLCFHLSACGTALLSLVKARLVPSANITSMLHLHLASHN